MENFDIIKTEENGVITVSLVKKKKEEKEKENILINNKK